MNAETPRPGPELNYMSPPIAEALPSIPPPSGTLQEPLALLRDLRAEVQDLRVALAEVSAGQAALAEKAPYVMQSVQDIADLIAAVRKQTFSPKVSDALRHIYNAWEVISSNPLLVEPATPQDADKQARYLGSLDGPFRVMEFHIGQLTIPDRLKDWLEGTDPGHCLPFHRVFEDEVPNTEDRTKILTWLGWSPTAIDGGLVDVSSGLIYRFATSRRTRAVYAAILLAFLAALSAAVWAACALPEYLGVTGWLFSPADSAALLLAWLALLVGIVVHEGIGDVKRQQREGVPPSIIPLATFPKMLNAKSGWITQRLVFGIIAFFGFAFTMGVEQLTVINAFLVGYSLDSFVELFAKSAEQQATAQVSTVKRQLGLDQK